MQQRRSTRKRGVILTNIGLQKLQTAKRKAEIWDNDGDRYTLEELGQRSGLAPITVAKVLNRETGVDKQSLVLCFSAFGLTLMDADFTKPSDRSLQAEDNNADPPSAIPQGWQVTGTHTQDYDVRLDTTIINGGSTTALIQSKSPQADGFVTLMQTFKAEDYRGQRLQLSGYLKTEAVETWAGLLRVQPNGANMRWYSMHLLPAIALRLGSYSRAPVAFGAIACNLNPLG